MSKLGNTNPSTLQQQVCLCVCLCVCVFAHLTQLNNWVTPRRLLPDIFKYVGQLSTSVSSPFLHLTTAQRGHPGLAVITLPVSVLVCVTSVCPSSVSSPPLCASLSSSRHGQEGRSQTNAGVVQAGAGEKRPRPLWVWTHDIVST